MYASLVTVKPTAHETTASVREAILARDAMSRMQDPADCFVSHTVVDLKQAENDAAVAAGYHKGFSDWCVKFQYANRLVTTRIDSRINQFKTTTEMKVKGNLQ